MNNKIPKQDSIHTLEATLRTVLRPCSGGGQDFVFPFRNMPGMEEIDAFLNMSWMAADADKGQAEEFLLFHPGNFQAVEVVRFHASNNLLNRPASRCRQVRTEGHHFDLTGHKEECPCRVTEFPVQCRAIQIPDQSPTLQIRRAFHLQALRQSRALFDEDHPYADFLCHWF